ncbi:MAG: hypothetical protein AAF675_17595 [Pseudomonadota bacterium]
MGTLLKYLFRLLLLGAVALAGYALFAELPAPRETVRVPLSGEGSGG